MIPWNASKPTRLTALAAAAVLLGAGVGQAQDSGPIDPARLSQIVKVLASDAFAGRAPGGPGEKKTLEYLISQFKAVGLEPGGEKGGWTQKVPLIRFQMKANATLKVVSGDQTVSLRQGQEVMVNTQRPVKRVKIDKAPLVFVGYGVSAAEREWDDFKGVDLRGKIAVFLINDPDFEAQPGEAVRGKFGGQAATYYARWTYKFEEAARRGAIGALIIHETPGAGYGWSTVTAGNGQTFDIVRAQPDKEKVLMQGWIQRDAAAVLLARAGLSLEKLKADARKASFEPVSLKGVSLSADYTLTHSRADSHNVIGRLPGTQRPNESIMYGGHWDAYGLGPPDASGNKVRHGAVDDAIGLAGMIEIARAFQQGPKPARSILFAAWTAEEPGLLGSEYYGAHPLQPLETMVANLTMDILQTAGPSRDVVLVGMGQNELEDALAEAASRQGRTLTPDAKPERGLFYRADHFSLAKRGVPVLLLMGLGGGHDLVNGGREAGDRWVADYTARCYHQPCDAWRSDWDLRGAAQDVQLLYEIGRELASPGRWPEWKPGSEFKGVRDRSAAARK
ncbi:M28 family metallopeptidase [Stigmatella sp. ncwal1]|uniref:M28 family metallopeptidase n=1 Tax=Stigmatella ashevillensis TaxID=2995309 RepID=A0ABT5DET6_9BACT|nr:M28 family metallopeptidase [Stigmatella ashevillena]MDC0712026.1 M28 family metallopeptidase [Stigmatella ashevillena]